MKKSLVLIGLLAAALALAAGLGPWYTSRVADRQIAAVVAAVNRQGMFEAHYVPTARSWFEQRDTLKLVPVDPRFRELQQHGPREIVLRLHVAYGPIPFAAWSRDGISFLPVGAVIDTRIDGLAKTLKKAGSGYRLRDIVTLDGGNSFSLHLDPGSMSGRRGAHLQWRAADLRLDQRGRHLSGNGHSGGLTITRDAPDASHVHIGPARLAIGDLRIVDGQSAGKLTFSWDGMQAGDASQSIDIGTLRFAMDTHLAQGIAVGKGEATLASLTVRPPAAAAAPAFALKHMTLASETREPHNDYADSDVRWTVADIAADGQHYAPAELELRLEHQYVPALRGIVQALRELRQDLKTQRDIPPQLAARRMIGVIMPPLQQLLEHRPVLRLTQLRLGTPQGMLRGQGEARLEPAGGATPSLTTLPEDLVAHFALDAPAALAHRLAAYALARQGVPADRLDSASQQYLDALRSQGLLRMQGTDYVLEVDYRNAALQLNGRTVWPH